MTKRFIAISPSGNFYGSEQVLFDYLSNTSLQFEVYVPANSILEEKIKAQGKHKTHAFKNIYGLYLSIFTKLLFKKTTIYLNEGGHSRYINVLSKLFKHQQFIVHLRIIEDMNHYRLSSNKNITYIAVSNFLSNFIEHGKRSIICLHDPFDINKYNNTQTSNFSGIKKIGIIGRVTPTKGLKEIQSFINHTELKKLNFEFHFFGDVEHDKQAVNNFIKSMELNQYSKCIFHGFVNTTKAIYKNIDLVLHLNINEALGRICFESYAFNLPLVGFNQGGIGEISRLIQTSEFTVEYKLGWEEQILNIIKNMNETKNSNLITQAKKNISIIFNPLIYTNKLDEIINNKTELH